MGDFKYKLTVDGQEVLTFYSHAILSEVQEFTIRRNYAHQHSLGLFGIGGIQVGLA